MPFEELLERFDSRGKCQPVCKPCGPFISTAFPYPLAGDEDIEKLNVLAQKIQAFPDQRTLAKFKAALELEIRNEIDFALDVAENLDCYDFDPKMYSPAAYAEEITVRKNKVREKNRLKGTYYRGENLAKYCNNELFLII